MARKKHLLNKCIQERSMTEEGLWQRLPSVSIVSSGRQTHQGESPPTWDMLYSKVCSVLQQHRGMKDDLHQEGFRSCPMFTFIWLYRMSGVWVHVGDTQSTTFFIPIPLPVSFLAPHLPRMTSQDFANPDHFFEFSETMVGGRKRWQRAAVGKREKRSTPQNLLT